jgi:hypothetical protein
MILHLMTQRDQPYGSVRKCCENCGLMMVARPPSFWRTHAWTDEPSEYKFYPANDHNGQYIPCNEIKTMENKE